MCRKPSGVSIGFVCQHHEGRCVICDLQFDEIAEAMAEVHLCDDCGLVPEGEQHCVMCGSGRISEVAYYCQYCVALEKDRDGCPRTLNQTRHQRIAAIKKSGMGELA